MKKKIISPEKIWQALLVDPRVKVIPPHQIDFFRQYVLESLEILSEILSKKANLKNIWEAKRVLEEYWFTKAEAELFSGKFSPTSISRFAFGDPEISAAEIVKIQVRKSENIALEVRYYLKTHGLTEAEALVLLGIDGEALAKFKKNKLTLGKLLELKPGVVI